MSGSDNKGPADVPAWQKAQSTPEVAAEVPAPSENADASTLDQAKKFLLDPEVQKETPKRKAEFLTSKGIPQSEVDELLRDEILQAQSESKTLVSHAVCPYCALRLTLCRSQQKRLQEMSAPQR